MELDEVVAMYEGGGEADGESVDRKVMGEESIGEFSSGCVAAEVPPMADCRIMSIARVFASIWSPIVPRKSIGLRWGVVGAVALIGGGGVRWRPTSPGGDVFGELVVISAFVGVSGA